MTMLRRVVMVLCLMSVAVCFGPPSAVRKAGFICEKRTFATTLWCSSVVYSEGLLSDEDTFLVLADIA
jgi:hypothetical protein